MGKKDVIEIYRSQVESRNEVPPESCWDEIDNRLDLEEVWDALSLELDRVLPVEKARSDRRKLIFIRYASLAASITLFTVILLSDGHKKDPTLAFSAVPQKPGVISARMDEVVSMQSEEEVTDIVKYPHSQSPEIIVENPAN